MVSSHAKAPHYWPFAGDLMIMCEFLLQRVSNAKGWCFPKGFHREIINVTVILIANGSFTAWGFNHRSIGLDWCLAQELLPIISHSHYLICCKWLFIGYWQLSYITFIISVVTHYNYGTISWQYGCMHDIQYFSEKPGGTGFQSLTAADSPQVSNEGFSPSWMLATLQVWLSDRLWPIIYNDYLSGGGLYT